MKSVCPPCIYAMFRMDAECSVSLEQKTLDVESPGENGENNGVFSSRFGCEGEADRAGCV